MSLNQEKNSSWILEEEERSNKKNAKPLYVIYNVHPNLKVCKSSLAHSFKSSSTPQEQEERKFLISGNKIKRRQSILDSLLNKPNDITPLEKNPKNDDSPNVNLLNAQNVDNVNVKIEVQKPENNEVRIENSANQEQIMLNSGQQIKTQSSEASQQHNLNPEKSSKEFPPSLQDIQASLPKTMIRHENTSKSLQILSGQSLPRNPLINPSKASLRTPLNNNSKDAMKALHSKDSVDFFSHHKRQEFFELNGHYFKNYKYKKYDVELLLAGPKNAFGQNLTNKLPMIGSRGFPSIEKIIEQNSNKQSISSSNTFEKLREDYLVWKQSLLTRRNNQEQIPVEEIKTREPAKTPNVVLKSRQKIYENMPKTSDCLLKTVLINRPKDLDFREKGRTDSIHQSKEGDIINCGFKRTFSKKFNIVFHEFQKLIERERSLFEGFQVVGRRKSIQKAEYSKKNEAKIQKKKQFQEDFHYQIELETLRKSYKFLQMMHEKIRKKIFALYRGKNGKEKIGFNEFLRFYEVFLQKPANYDEIAEFMIEFLRPKENSVQGLLKNVKIMLKNIVDKNKKQETYGYLLQAFTEAKLITRSPASLDFSLITTVFEEKRLNPMDLFALITQFQ